MPKNRSDDRPVLTGFEESQIPYESPSQRARVWTETWAQKWLFCPSCGNDQLCRFAANLPAADLHCQECNEQYELKSKNGKFGRKIVDGAYRTLIQRLLEDTNPNFAFLSYDMRERAVKNLFVVPKQFVMGEIIEERRPLSLNARRAGWIGCNIRLGQIPDSGKSFIVRDGAAVSRKQVQSQWRSTLFLRHENLEARGWLIDVMRCCEAIGQKTFSLTELYAFEDKLAAMYPGNRHIRQKVRQQLQVLRDNGYIEFISRGVYRLRD